MNEFYYGESKYKSYYIESLFYELNFGKIKFILKTIFMPRFCKIKVDSSRFDLT